MSLSPTELKQHIAAVGRSDWRALMRLFEDGFHRDALTVTADTTLEAAEHGGRMVVVNKADGAAITLPASTGSGVVFRLLLGTTVTSNSTTVKAANGDDTMIGVVHTATTTAGAGLHEAAGGTDDTITMNGTTTGGIKGSYIELEDAVENEWRVKGELVGSGTLATSLSATVS